MELREMTKEERRHWFDAELAEAFLPADLEPVMEAHRALYHYRSDVRVP